MPDEDDRPRDAFGAAHDAWDAAWADDDSWTDVVIPDDIRELAPDIAAYHRELRAARRNEWIGRQLSRRGALTSCILLGALIVAALAAGAMTALTPTTAPSQLAAAPIAAPAVADGHVGGLLPSVLLRTTDQQPVAARALRPKAIALVPLHCDCTNLLDLVGAQATKSRLSLAVVAPAATDAEAAALPGQLHSVEPDVFFDPAAAVADSVRSTGVTVVLVKPDGTISSIQRSMTVAAIPALADQLRQFAGTSSG
ncbi:MAG TPA: hypothetical protein VG708_11165 [Mycobacteriales bacterium]|nr:hypothetical protein [Mycobacteriales bacterium]